MNKSVQTRVQLPAARLVSVLAAAAVAVVLTACGGGKGDKASQTAAKVNKEEITVHQINFVLQRQQGLKPEQAEAAGRQVLERLIEQELAVQKAQDMKLDRDPRVVAQIEAAKREIIARAFIDKLGENLKPTAEEVTKYYNEKPALFKDRRIYNLQELVIEAKPEQIPQLRAKLNEAKSMAEFAEFLKTHDYRFSGNQAVRAAEQLPLTGLDTIAKMKDGDSAVTQTPNGITVLFLGGSRSQPVDEARARPLIESFLVNQRKSELAQKEIKSLRDAAKIEYVGKFAENRPAAGAAPALSIDASAPGQTPAALTTPAPATAPTAAAPVASAASGLDAAAISKGMGLK